MKIYTDRAIYSYAGDNPEKLKPLGTSTIPTTLPTTLATTKEQKEAQRKADREKKKLERTQKRTERKEVRQEKRAVRRAKRQAKRLLRAKDKTGRKKWFYPISRVFKGKKKQKDGTIVEVEPKNIVTTTSGAQFDKTEIATATGVPVDQVTAQMAEQVFFTNPQGSATVSENTTLSPFVAKRDDVTTNPNATAEEVLNSITTVYAPVNDNKEVVQGEDGAIYMADETTSQEEPPISEEEFNAMTKKSETEAKKGLGVWGWVGISAIVVGLGVGAVLLYKMSKGKQP
jgi:hypothetical protein